MLIHSDISYQRHEEFLERRMMYARAELQGFRDARWAKVCPTWADDPVEQQHYASGFDDGKAKLLQEAPCATTNESETLI